MTNIDISIIIRTLNEGRYLDQLLLGISNQKTEFTYEVVLIDSGSTDETLSIAKWYGCNILHINRDEFSFGRSLNRACEASLGQYLVLISGHCIPKGNTWMQNLVEPLSKGVVEYVYGRQVGGDSTYWSESQIFDKYFPAETQLPQTGFYCNNANSAINRRTWSLYQFDEDLTGLEDMHLAKRLVAAGGVVGYAAEACVYHLHHETWAQIQRRFEREALALQRICPEVILRNRDFLRYFLRAIIKDLSTSRLRLFDPKHIYSVIRYRFSQYLGSYKGNHIHKKLSRQIRDSYFYPTQSKGLPFSTQ